MIALAEFGSCVESQSYYRLTEMQKTMEEADVLEEHKEFSFGLVKFEVLVDIQMCIGSCTSKERSQLQL